MFAFVYISVTNLLKEVGLMESFVIEKRIENSPVGFSLNSWVI